MHLFSTKHSNRSKQALDEHQSSSATSTTFAAADVREARTTESFDTAARQQHQHPLQQQQQQQQQQEARYYAHHTVAPDVDPRAYQKPSQPPTRSQSTRYASGYQQPLHAGGSADDLALDSRRKHSQQPGPSAHQLPVAEHKKSKSIFSRMRGSSSQIPESKAPPPQASYGNKDGLNRRLSKRQEHPPVIRTQHIQSIEGQRHDWQSGKASSRSHLPSPQEGYEDLEQDPFLVRPSEQENPRSAHSGSKEHIHSYPQTIRTESGELPPAAYEDKSQESETQQPHLREQLALPQLEPPSQNYYHSPHEDQVNISPGGLLARDQYRQRNPETVSQLSYESLVDQGREEQRLERPVSVQSNNGASPTHSTLRQDYPNRTTSIAPSNSRPLSQFTPAGMAPPGGVSANRRSTDAKQTLQQGAQGQGEPSSRDGPPPNYSRGAFPGNATSTPALNPLPNTATVAQGPGYRGGPPQRDQFGAAGGGEQGRSTPPPAPADRDVNDAYKELLTKYKKVKGLYFDKTAQVEQLQNTLANQRLSQSRTSLDDSEYMTRFQRLDGATTNLAFNIRKDWRTVPAWLSQHVNQDAIKIGKQEMTAVGRACITKFLVDEIFNRTFHPGLEGELSFSLKNIEHNIRRFSPPLNNQEESDALTSKVVQWRLATLEGLKDVLSTSESEDFKAQFSRTATNSLTASLINLLNEPVPPGIEDSAHMIVELAVSIASNLPLESRDISISYPMPGDMLHAGHMKADSQIPALDNPGAETNSEVDAASTNSVDKEESSKEEKSTDGKNRKEKTKSTMLQAMMGGGSSTGSKKSSISAQGGEAAQESKKVSSEDGAQKVRFAGFVSVEVRGRQVLVKAPVWTLS